MFTYTDNHTECHMSVDTQSQFTPFVYHETSAKLYRLLWSHRKSASSAIAGNSLSWHIFTAALLLCCLHNVCCLIIWTLLRSSKINKTATYIYITWCQGTKLITSTRSHFKPHTSPADLEAFTIASRNKCVHLWKNEDTLKTKGFSDFCCTELNSIKVEC